MEFKVLSHACLLVKQDGRSIIIDPWLVGSCYWRSWWNFPRSNFDESDIAAVDAVLISHIHWDHWHGPTLKKFFNGKTIFIPDSPGLRSEEDLRAIGFKKIVRLAHGVTFEFLNIKITFYQFGLFFDDAAIVIEAGGTVILNANDAKIAGCALDGLLKQHPRIDFAFRSHSSANTRICFEITQCPSEIMDDRNHYFKAFEAFMDAVNPRFAVPFASNHCHLHDDVLKFNSYISNPLQLRTYCDSLSARPWTLKVMLPGSSWNDSCGFTLSPETDFVDLGKSLEAYQASVRTVLTDYRATENKVSLTEDLINRFAALFAVRFLPPKCRGEFTVTVRWPDGRRKSFSCDIGTGKATFLDVEREPEKHRPVIEIPAIVFRDAVRKNMFQHAGISKRCRFISVDVEDHRRLAAIITFLELREAGVYPIVWSRVRRLLAAYVGRWRELIVYLQAFWLLKVRKERIYSVEESILRGKI